MRTFLLLLGLALLATAACTDAVDESTTARSVRDRLEDPDGTRLMVAPPRSAGSISAERRVGHDWEVGLVDLRVESGELVVRAAGGAITIEQLAFSLAPIEVPATVVGTRAQLVDVRATLRTPVLTTATWDDTDDEVHAVTKLQLDLSWAVEVDGSRLELGAPTLPPLPVELRVTGTAEQPRADLRLRAAGEVWSWADVVRLVDLFVIVAAE